MPTCFTHITFLFLLATSEALNCYTQTSCSGSGCVGAVTTDPVDTSCQAGLDVCLRATWEVTGVGLGFAQQQGGFPDMETDIFYKNRHNPEYVPCVTGMSLKKGARRKYYPQILHAFSILSP
ncbi:hypothetical protein HOLleu_29040 [Holothuria leucospilota]|uniref:Uncharacterized protein n=1 Tax=Holothuria leucospilota TaxID=206669 RepID=A0A9Q1BN28_HOLLE|nr:hypothetical protein HOLleu_29040 [Holothuria leucospilota]